VAQGAYDLAEAYAHEREQFGRPIARFQAVQFRLADMATEIEAARNLVYKAAWVKDQDRPFGKEAAIAKLYSGEMSNRVVNWALQVHGGYGYMDEFAISRLYRDQKILEIGEGTNEVQRMVIARHLGLRRDDALPRVLALSLVAATAAAAGALVVPFPAFAHVTVAPTRVEAGERTLVFTVPNEFGGASGRSRIDEVVIAAPAGVRLGNVEAKAGW